MHFRFGIVAGLAVVYFAAAKVGLLLAAVSPRAEPAVRFATVSVLALIKAGAGRI